MSWPRVLSLPFSLPFNSPPFLLSFLWTLRNATSAPYIVKRTESSDTRARARSPWTKRTLLWKNDQTRKRENPVRAFARSSFPFYTSTTTRTKSERRNRKLKGNTRSGGGKVEERGVGRNGFSPRKPFASLPFSNCLFAPFVSLKIEERCHTLSHVPRGAGSWIPRFEVLFKVRWFYYELLSQITPTLYLMINKTLINKKFHQTPMRNVITLVLLGKAPIFPRICTHCPGSTVSSRRLFVRLYFHSFKMYKMFCPFFQVSSN